MSNIRDNSMSRGSGIDLRGPIAARGVKDITTDLSWVDMLKGIAIIGVFFENWLTYFSQHQLITDTPDLFSSLTSILDIVSGPFMQVFIILSGFGLTLAYWKRHNAGWSWKAWAWRRITKIIFPYYLCILLSLLLGLLGSALFETVKFNFSWPSLIALLTLTRNFYPPSWAWNPPLWYMPVIVGLYIIFPFLLTILKKWGPVKLLLVSTLVTYISLILAFVSGMTGTHGSDLFMSWTVQFVLGMLLAYFSINHTEKLHLLIGIRPFVIGAALFFCSWILRTYIPNGKVFNDPITSTGLFLLLLNIGWGLRRVIPAAHKLLIALSEPSYFMYLIHYPVMMFLVGPIFKSSMHPLIVVALCGLYVVAIYYLSSWISRPITNISAKLNTISSRKQAWARG